MTSPDKGIQTNLGGLSDSDPFVPRNYRNFSRDMDERTCYPDELDWQA